MSAALIGAVLFVLGMVGWAWREDRRWQRLPRTVLTLPTWDGLPREDMAALPELDPFDPELETP